MATDADLGQEISRLSKELGETKKELAQLRAELSSFAKRFKKHRHEFTHKGGAEDETSRPAEK